MELVPIFRSFSRVMIMLKEWVIEEPVIDTLVVVDLRVGVITSGLWSGQKILKSDEFGSIHPDQRD